MIFLLQIALIMVLFIISRIVIGKIMGKRVRRVIFEKIEENKRWSIDKDLTKNIILFLGVLLLSLLNEYDICFSLVIGSLAVFVLYGVKAIKKSLKRKQILQDLLNISECLRVQISSQIPLGNALRTLPALCVNKEFVSLLTNIYLEYELSKFVILDAGEMLINKFNYPEMRIFISALNQQIQGTSAIEAFDSLVSGLREKYIEFLEDSTKSKMAIMTMGVFIIVLNIAAIGIYPVAVEAFNAINVMLK